MSWRLEGLFEWELHPEENDLSRWWRDQPTAIPAGKMGYRRRVTLAGPRLECEIYPVFGRTDEKIRAARKNMTPEKQKRLNRERAIRHLVQLADANFCEKDIHLTLTYINAPEWERVCKDVRNFILRVKRYREKKGIDELKYIYTIEGNREKVNGCGVERIHIHMLMNGGVSREKLEEMWELGYANADRLQPDERGLEAVARYIIKEQKTGRKWCASRNLKQPKRRSSDAKTSNRVVKAIAGDFRNEAKIEMEKMYPAYQFVDCKVFYSDQLDGVYIRVLMRRKDKTGFTSQKLAGRRRE